MQPSQGIGAAQDAARMQRVVGFYSKLPRGPAPEPEAKGIIGWYRKKYFGKNSASAARKPFLKATSRRCE